MIYFPIRCRLHDIFSLHMLYFATNYFFIFNFSNTCCFYYIIPYYIHFFNIFPHQMVFTQHITFQYHIYVKILLTIIYNYFQIHVVFVIYFSIRWYLRVIFLYIFKLYIFFNRRCVYDILYQSVSCCYFLLPHQMKFKGYIFLINQIFMIYFFIKQCLHNKFSYEIIYLCKISLQNCKFIIHFHIKLCICFTFPHLALYL